MLIQNKKHKYISFHDYNNSNGFSVRVPFLDSEKQLRVKQKGVGGWFSIAKYKTKLAAFNAAIVYRDKQLAKIKCRKLLNKTLGTPITSNHRNTSGVIGVTLGENSKHGVTYFGYLAQYQDKTGKQRGRYFAIDKWGMKTAFKMACAVRFEHCGTLYIEYPEMIPCLPEQKYIINE